MAEKARRGRTEKPFENRKRTGTLFDFKRSWGGIADLASERNSHKGRADGFFEKTAVARRIQISCYSAHCKNRFVQNFRALGNIQGKHVCPDKNRRRRISAQADELPAPYTGLQNEKELLQGASFEVCGIRNCLQI